MRVTHLYSGMDQVISIRESYANMAYFTGNRWASIMFSKMYSRAKHRQNIEYLVDEAQKIVA